MAIKRDINEIAYSFFKFNDTDETHIFEGKFTPEGCNHKFISICKKIDRRIEDTTNIKSCLDEDQARQKAANLGRIVCGVCVSHLYTTYQEKI